MKFALKISAAVLGAALLAGCAIQAGTDNKASVEKTLGRPSFVGEFTPNDWYYVSRDTNQFAFRNPRVTQQTVLLVRFDQAGNVTSVQRTGKEMILALNPAKRKTPTLGRQKSFFDEIFGNIGTVGSAAPTPSQ